MEGSFSRSMERAVKHYSSLFRLPSHRKVVLLQVLICVCGGSFSTFVLSPSIKGLVDGLIFGSTLFFLSLSLDYVLGAVVLGQDPIYDPRRIAAVSLFCWGLWYLFIIVGALVGAVFGLSWWVRLCLLGFSAVFVLRLIVFRVSSSVNFSRLLALSFLPPFSCLFPFLALWVEIGYQATFNNACAVALFLIFSPSLGLVLTYSFLFLLDRVGEREFKIRSLSLFKAFLVNWIAGLNGPFEEFLEELSKEQKISASLVRFDSSKPKAVIAVPAVHPGPFKNVGSSLLPSLLKTALERELGCVACVPLGLQGHELDLASQAQNQKVIDHIVESTEFVTSESGATRLIRVNSGFATACCQVFGSLAFLSLSLAPKTTEDLPQELGLFVRQEAEKYKLSSCVVANAHNSLDGVMSASEASKALKSAAASCLREAVSAEQLPFEVGAATVMPEVFSLSDGMGAGGITAIVIRVGDQRSAYVVIDGNNMVSGLRERILSVLYSIGIDGGEVFTTDTHSVSATVLGGRGYHPVGEVMDQGKLISCIEEATLSAMSNLEPARTACRTITVPNVKVIGEERLEALTLLIDRTLRRAKRVVVPIFTIGGLLLMMFLQFV